ncbi:MAG: hypothetical protein RIR94_1605 [Bacteroidota bacterium]
MRSFLSLLLILILAGCALEEAQPQKDSQLIIAQNFMSAAQKKILTKIAKRRSIDLTILDLNSGKIRKAVKKQPWEPGFDLILLDGIAALKNLEGLSFQYHQPAFAAIPIGVSYVPDSVVKVRHFKDLSSQYLWAAADTKSEAVLKAHLAYIYRQRETNKQLNKVYKDLMRGFKDHKLAFDSYQLQNTLLLCRYDTHLQVLKKAVKKRQFTFALKNQNRYFADYMSLSIIEQTPNYRAAQKFVAYLNYMCDHNSAFRNAFGIIAKRKVAPQPKPKVLLEFLEK